MKQVEDTILICNRDAKTVQLFHGHAICHYEGENPLVNPLHLYDRVEGYLPEIYELVQPGSTQWTSGMSELSNWRDATTLIQCTAINALFAYKFPESLETPDTVVYFFTTENDSGEMTLGNFLRRHGYDPLDGLLEWEKFMEDFDPARFVIPCDGGCRILEAMQTCGWYNGLREEVAAIADHIIRNTGLMYTRKFVPRPEGLNYNTRAEYSYLWMMLVCMFGDYGTSPRYGWIEKPLKALRFILLIQPDLEDDEKWECRIDSAKMEE